VNSLDVVAELAEGGGGGGPGETGADDDDLELALVGGLTSRTENLWFSHFSAMGPSGTLESSRTVISVSYQTEEQHQGHR
jgi:hypothetical protein